MCMMSGLILGNSESIFRLGALSGPPFLCGMDWGFPVGVGLGLFLARLFCGGGLGAFSGAHLSCGGGGGALPGPPYSSY